MLKEYMSCTGSDFSPVLAKIKNLIVTTVISTHTSNSSGSRLFVPNAYVYKIRFVEKFKVDKLSRIFNIGQAVTSSMVLMFYWIEI